jgi:hypothetical protein
VESGFRSTGFVTALAEVEGRVEVGDEAEGDA